MFNLIRRISYGVIPRPDRPWEEDATSNAPAPGRKRRLSSTERDTRDNTEELARSKKARNGSQSPETDTQEGERETPLPQPEAETKDVTEVTQGVKEVVLDGEATEKPDADVGVAGEPTPAKESSIAPESVPLPEGELDDLADAPSSPTGSEEAEGEEDESATSEHAEREGETVSVEPKVEVTSISVTSSEGAAEKKGTVEDSETGKSADITTKESPKEQPASTTE